MLLHRLLALFRLSNLFGAGKTTLHRAPLPVRSSVLILRVTPLLTRFFLSCVVLLPVCANWIGVARICAVIGRSEILDAFLVRQLIDNLSDKVSDLVYAVVVLQEQNAEMPPTLPGASGQVMQTATQLVKVAHQLAAVNYKNFESIATEIRQAADAVTGASGTMTSAIQQLETTTDRAKAWTLLTEACRLMAGKTIRLLQIVYGADLKRLFAVANQVHKNLGEMDLAKAVDNPDEFAEWATALATKANQMATYMEARAKDELSPVTKAKLTQMSAELKQLAHDLVDNVNDLLDDPTDQAKREAVSRLAKALERLVEEAGLYLVETQTELPGFNEATLDSLAIAMARRKAELEEAERKAREEAEIAEAKRVAIQRAKALEMLNATMVDAPSSTSSLAREVARAQAALQELQKAAFARDADGVRQWAQEATNALEALREAAKREAEETTDPARRQHILNTLRQIEQSLPAQLALAKKLVEDPTEEDHRAMRKVHGDAQNWLAELLAATRTDDLLERANRADRAAELIARAVADKKSADDRQVLGEDFARLNEQVLHIAKFQAQNAFSDRTRTDLSSAISRLTAAASNLSNLGHIHDSTDPNAVSTSATSDAAREYREALQSLQAQANAQAIGSLAAVVRDLDSVHRHALAENRTGVQTASLQMIKDGKAALEAAKRAASKEGWSENPDEKARLDAAIAEVDIRLKDEMIAVRAFMETGTAESQNAKRKAALQNVMLTERPVRDAISYLEAILSGQVPEMEYMESPGDEAAIAVAAVELNEIAVQVVDLARVVQQANEGTTESTTAVKELEVLLTSIQSESSAIIEALAENDPDERLVAKAAETVEYIRQLREAAQASPAELVSASHRLATMVKELQTEITVKVADTKDAEQAEALNAQSQAIGDLLKETVVVTRSVLEQGFPAHKDSFINKTHLLKRAVQRTAAAVRPEDQDERIMRDTYAALQNKLQEVADAAASKDSKKVDDRLSEIDKVGKEYMRAAQKRKAKRKPGFIQSAETDPLAEFRALASRIGHPAREAAGGAEKTRELDNVSAQMTSVARVNNTDHVVDKIAAFQDVDATMGDIEAAVERNDGDRVTVLTKQLIKQMEVLPPIAEGEDDPEKKKGLREAVVELNDRVRDACQRAAAALRAPTDDRAIPELGAAVDSARVPSARAVAILSPCDDRSIDEVLRVAQAAVSTQGPAGAHAEVQRAIDVSNSIAAKNKDQHKRRHIEAAVNQVKEQLETLNSPSEQAATKLDVQESLDVLYHTLHTSAKTDVVELAGTVKGGAAQIDADLKESKKNGGKIDKPSFDKKATRVVAQMEDLRDSALGVNTGAPLPASKADKSVDLDNFLDAIEKAHIPPKPVNKTVQELLDSMAGMKKEEPKTFEEALDRAAHDIASAIQQSSQNETAPEVIASTGIAGAMAKLAKAARAGQKSEMMLAAKQIFTHLNQLIAESNATAAKLGPKNARESDRLLRAAQAMRNFGTQIKILTSVKAASIEQDTDNDETLLSITNGLRNIVTDTIKTLDTTKRVILKIR